MIDRKRRFARTAVLASAVVAPDNIPPRKLDLFVRQMNISHKADDAGVGQRGRDGMDPALFAFSDKLGLCKKQKNKSAFYIANAYGFVALIEYEYPPA